MSYIPKEHEIYKHYKGNLYQIVTIAEHSETGERLVVYRTLLGGSKIYACPLGRFTGKVDSSDKERDSGATQEYRFELQDPRKSVVEAVPSDQGDAQELQEPSLEQDTYVPSQEPQIDPMVMEFLEASSYEARLNILSGIHHRITDDMITTMSIACDVEVKEGEVEERYESLRSCLLTLEKYECNRMR